MSRFCRIVAFSLSVCVICLAAAPVFAIEENSTLGVEAEETATKELRNNAIIANCPSIKIQLENIQRADSKNRVQLGSYFSNLNIYYLQRLNLRLVKNGIATGELIDQQSNYVAEFNSFKSHFTEYSHSLQELTAIDCREDPDAFYSKLITTRIKRAKVSNNISQLEDIIKQHRDSVRTLREKL